jgi:ABC-type uncharacterized transport system auxiliary subunit
MRFQPTGFRSARLALTAGLLALLAGCGGLLKSNADTEQLYTLRPVAPASVPGTAPIAGMIIVSRPVVQPGLASARIALTRPGNRLDYFAASRWSAQLPQVVGALTAEMLLAAGQFEVAADGERVSGGARYELLLTVRHFEAEYGTDNAAAPDARVEFECLIASALPRVILGRCDSTARVPAGANRMGAIVEALEAAAQQALGKSIAEAARVAGEAQSRTDTPRAR